MDPSSKPVLVFCPYLELPATTHFEGWLIGPLDAFDGNWDPPELQAAAHELMARFRDAKNGELTRPTLIADVSRGVTGDLPPDPEALTLAVGLGALVSNPREPEDRQAWRVITADNADLWIQPMDLINQRISIERGSIVRALSGGHKYTDPRFVIASPLELHMDGRCLFDEGVAASVYRAVRSPDDLVSAQRLRLAIRWWMKSWDNSSRISWDDRIVHLRVAIDALVGSDKTTQAIAHLNDLFGSIPPLQRGDGLLWDGSDKSTFPRTYGGKEVELTAFEHWFWSFADARNEIIHEGKSRSLQYEIDPSPYVGDFVTVGQRLVLEAILVSAHRLAGGFPWHSRIWRALEEQFSSGGVAMDDS